MSILSASWQYTNYSSTFSTEENNQRNLHALQMFFPSPQASHLLRSHFIVRSQPNAHILAPPLPNPHIAHAHRHILPLKKYSLIHIKSSIHCLYVSNVALGKLICTSRTDHDSKIIILGKDGTRSLERLGAIFTSLFALSICHWSLLLWC